MKLAKKQYEYEKQLALIDVRKSTSREQMIEDRKDQRSKMEATQQSAMIQQRQDGLLPTDFGDQAQGPSIEQELNTQMPPMEQDQMQMPM